MWGQGLMPPNVVAERRIIPTRVGTSQQGLCYFLGKQDHPHACGDKSQLPFPITNNVGSSPRVWGQVADLMARSPNFGIIPTRVGTSAEGNESKATNKDHPHACGDKSCFVNSSCIDSGSSPRVWGQAVPQSPLCYADRIIPTRVGTRLSQQDSALSL